MKRLILVAVLFLSACAVIEVETPSPDMIECTDPRPEACTMDYRPVCGLVRVECIRAPCPPIEETFSNGCSACSNPRVIGYVEGQCRE